MALAAGSYRWSVRALGGELKSAASATWTVRVVEPQTFVESPDREAYEEVPFLLRMGSLFVGPTLAYHSNFGEIAAVRIGAEAGYRYRLSSGHEVGTAARGGYYTEKITFRDQETGIQVASRLHGVPIELVALYAVPMHLAMIHVGLGLATTVSYTTVSVSGQPNRKVVNFDGGAIALLGLERALGPGGLWMEVSYMLSTHSRGLVETDPGGIAVASGYRLDVWP
jgi:hypothetical protein